MKRSFSSNEVVALTGITPRQLQWWDERGIVVPGRAGRRRLYSVDDLAEIAVIVEMRRKGFSLQRMRKIMRFLEREFGRRLVDTVRRGADTHLLTDGRSIFLEDSAKRVVDVLKNCRQPVFSICLSDTVRQVHADIRGWRRKGQQSVTAAPRGRQRKLA